jgi:hypothetical protein
LPPIDFYFPYIWFSGDVVNLCENYNNLNDSQKIDILSFNSRDDLNGWYIFRCINNYDVSVFFPDPRIIKKILKHVDKEFENG